MVDNTKQKRLMAQIVPSTASCVSAGNGSATTWTIAGTTTAYTGTITTDGYNVSATLVWADPGTTTPSTAGETLASGNQVAMGTCVATLGTDNTIALGVASLAI